MRAQQELRGAVIMIESVIEGLWEFLKECPVLSKYTVGVNFRNDDMDCAGIVEDETDTLRKYLSGASLMALHASLFLGALSYADLQRIKNSAFLTDLRKWFRTASDEKKLPQLPDGYTAQDIAMDSAIPFEYEDEGKKCTYQMHITLEYIEERTDVL